MVAGTVTSSAVPGAADTSRTDGRLHACASSSCPTRTWRRRPVCLTPCGRCLIDAPARRLIDPEGDATPISEQDFELLEVFLRHPRQALSRDRLCELARVGLISRTVRKGPPVGVSYQLTDRGAALLPALEALGRWAHENLPAEARHGDGC